ncbi:Extracellular solute-binding protein [Acidiphilium sp. PM]|nr:Extracellular solute-binding protein [Acidiphilium sp. PM]
MRRGSVLMRSRLLAAVILAMVAAGPSFSAGRCDTVVVPPGLGLGTPPASVDSLNPFLIGSAYDAEAAGLLYDGLLWISRNHTITWSRSIASAIEVSDDKTTFTVTMKPRTWSDGVPVTAEDVKFTFDLIRKLGKTYTGYGQGGMPGLVKSLNVLGPHRFRVVLKRSVNPTWFELTGLSQLTPFPAHAWTRYSVNQMWRLQSTPSFFRVVDGPFRIGRYVMGRYISFVPNPTYQGHKPDIRRFIMVFLNSDGAVFEGLRTGTLDAGNLPFSLWRAQRKLPDARELRLPPNFGFDYMELSYRNPKVAFFRDVRVRQAIADAIDQKRIIRLLLHGTTKPQHGPVPVDPPTFLSPAAKAGKYPVGYDTAKAKALLAAAGWKPGPDGIRMKDGKRLAFTDVIPSGNVTGQLGAELIQADLRAVGIAMTIREVTFSQMLVLSYKPLQWEAMQFGWALGVYPDDSAQLASDGAFNQSGYSDARMDALLKDVQTKPGLEPLYAYQDYAAAQQPEIFLPEPGSVVLVRNGLEGVRKFLSPTGAWSPQYLHWAPGACGGRR